MTKLFFLTALLLITSVLSNPFDGITNTVNQAVQSVKEAEQKAVNSIVQTEKKVVEEVKKEEEKVVTNVVETEKKAVEGVKETGNKVATEVKEDEEKAAKAIKEAEQKAMDSAKKTEEKFVSGVKDATGKVVQSVEDAGHKAAESIRKAGRKVKNSFKNAEDRLFHAISEDYNILKERIHPSLKPTGPQILVAPKGPAVNSLLYIRGFFDGMNVTTAFDSMKNCITDSIGLWHTIRNGTVHIGIWNSNEVKEGLKILGDSVEDILLALRSCNSSAVDDHQLEQLVKTFTEPVDFNFIDGQDVNNTVFTINKVNMVKEAVEIFNAAQIQDYRRIGFWVSTAMLKIFNQHDDTKVVVYKIEAIDGSDDGPAPLIESYGYEETTRRYFLNRFGYQPISAI